MTRLGLSWIDDVGEIIASAIPKFSNIDLGSAQNPFRNLYLSGSVVGSGSETITGNLTVTGNTSLGGTLAATGAATLSSTLHTVGAATLDSTLAVTGTSAFTGASVFTSTVRASGFNLTDGSDKNYSLSVYAAGTAYQLTNTAAALTFGTTSPSLTLDKAGTYLLLARVNLLYNGATFAASRTVTLKLRRTNNTAADLTNGTATAATDIVTTKTFTFGVFELPQVIYTTALTNDAIALFGDVSVVPTAGSLDAVAANIVAIRLK